MKEEEIYVKLFGFGSPTTFYSWKKDPKRLAIKLLEKYFTKEDLEEFLETGKINKMENIQHLGSFISYIVDINNTIVDKTTVDNKDELSLFLIKTIVEFKDSSFFSNYPDDVFDEFIDFVLNNTKEQNKKVLLQIPHKINKDTFYMYVQNIELLDDYKYNEPYVYSNFIK
ncbi:hypothetical protein [Sulfurimonas sp. CS5]|uniref:hypothetical protein n=1 Tax=Sulfurimonas sp. CS5 TaxID=3391145 RepID=UPI0039ED336C